MPSFHPKPRAFRKNVPSDSHHGASKSAWAVLLLCLLISSCAITRTTGHSRTAAAELTAARKASREGRWQAAAGLWQEIFQRADENSREACAETARALIELGDPKSAQNLAELGSKTFPKDSGFYVLQARALAAQGLLHAADTAYEHALREDPKQDKVVFALASLRFDLGQPDSTLTLLAPRVNSGAANAAEFTLAAKAQKVLKRFPEAFVSFERAFALEAPTADGLVQAASMYAEEGVRKKDARAATLAKTWLTRALAIDPQATLGHVYLGMIAEDEQHDGEAATYYRRAVETDPACVLALTSLAKVQQRRGEAENSKAMAERALALEKDPAKRAALEELAHPKPAEPAPGDVVDTTPKSGG